MTETIPVYIKGTGEVLQAEPAPGNQAIVTPPQALPKGDAKATAKTAKVTLVLDPASITRVLSEGQKQTKLIVTVDTMKFEAMVNSKSYRKALASIDELGADSCAVILQATMTRPGTLESAGLAVQQKTPKADA
jgi:propanediol dehydratase small subunit